MNEFLEDGRIKLPVFSGVEELRRFHTNNTTGAVSASLR